ncbi:MAG: type II toxin-antitoxin system VapC family toxin [Sulfolobaceae archaeon]|nr:type II toxin-antitoxin system VapC family toxin [Sulfolobaceae archaeon]
MGCKCLDSDIIIDFLRGKVEAVRYMERAVEEGELCTTVLNVFEVVYGAYKYGKNVDRTVEFFKTLKVLGLDLDSAILAGKLLSELESKGKPIEMRDLIIGSIALSNGCEVVTGNVRHFSKISGLKVCNWKG